MHNSFLMQFIVINICQVIIFKNYTVYKKHDDVKKLAIKPEENCIPEFEKFVSENSYLM